jgi:hypothetical protein
MTISRKKVVSRKAIYRRLWVKGIPGYKIWKACRIEKKDILGLTQ